MTESRPRARRADVWITTLEAAEYAEVSTTMIYRAARSGLLASGRVGNRYRFKHADIDRWISTKEEGKQ